MKTNSKIMILAALAGFLASSCGNENNNQPEPMPNEEQGITFSFTEQDYESDQELTRATPRTETADLSDCEAEVSVENDPDITVNKTRAITNKHYTIRAYRNGVKIGEIRGTFNGSTFTHDVTSPKDLPLNFGMTYDLVAFNDDVIPMGDNLTVSLDKASTAFIGTTTVLANHPKKMQVAFTMKHVGARLRIQFLCQKDIPGNITTTIAGTTANTLPVSISYNPMTKAYTSTTGSMTPRTNNSPASTQAKYTASNGGQTFNYTSTSSNYHYFLPTTTGTDIKLNLSGGTVFWNPLTGSIPKLGATLTMQSGKSYLIKIKLKPRFTYLFSDGTTGFRSQTTYGGAPAATAKTPIAVVVGQGRAVALRPVIYSGIFGKKIQHFTTMFADFTTCISDMRGYEYTWETTYSVNGTVKANDLNAAEGFFKAGRYNPGVSTTWLQQSAHRWYVPAYGEWKLFYLTLGFGNESLLIGTPSSSQYWSFTSSCYGYLAMQAFTQVGGGIFSNRYYLSSTESDPSWFAELNLSSTNIYWSGDGLKDWSAYVNLPFIKYQ